MSNQDSLLGFLKKKSLFNPSPVRHQAGKRSRSKSKEGKESIIRKINDKDFEDNNSPILRLNPAFQAQEPPPKREFVPRENQQPFQDNNYKRVNSINELQQNNERLKQSQIKYNFNVQDKGNRFLPGLVSYSTSFESARVESLQCLETLSLKLNTEISNVNYRLDQFRNNMAKVINYELKALRDQILQLVDEAFKESERTIKEYMKIEEQRLAVDLLKVRQILEKQYIRVETMKEQITLPQWRKVAGEILATELEKNIQQVVNKSKNTEIGRWETKNLSGQRLKTLEKQLRDLVRLRE